MNRKLHQQFIECLLVCGPVPERPAASAHLSRAGIEAFKERVSFSKRITEFYVNRIFRPGNLGINEWTRQFYHWVQHDSNHQPMLLDLTQLHNLEAALEEELDKGIT